MHFAHAKKIGDNILVGAELGKHSLIRGHYVFPARPDLIFMILG
jgi:hypothetical protein